MYCPTNRPAAFRATARPPTGPDRPPIRHRHDKTHTVILHGRVVSTPETRTDMTAVHAFTRDAAHAARALRAADAHSRHTSAARANLSCSLQAATAARAVHVAALENQQRVSRPADVVLSYGLGGHKTSSLLDAVRNALHFTHGPLLAHVSMEGHGRMPVHIRKQADQRALELRHQLVRLDAARVEPRRLFVNPWSLVVSKSTPGVLAAHLANLRFCLQLRICAADTRFVLLAANVVLVRPGLEAHVRAHSLSFCASDADAGCDFFEQRSGGGGGAPAAAQRQRVLWPAGPCCAGCACDSYFAGFPALLSADVPGWRLRAARAFGHEGSFYPAGLLREFAELLAQGPFGQALEAQQNGGCTHSTCFGLYATLEARTHAWVCVRERDVVAEGVDFNFTRPSGPLPPLPPRAAAVAEGVARRRWCPTKDGANKLMTAQGVARASFRQGACQLEELLLPTFVQQRAAHLIDNSSRPLVARTFTLRAAPAAAAAAGSHIFGVKVARQTFNGTAHALRVPQQLARSAPPRGEDARREWMSMSSAKMRGVQRRWPVWDDTRLQI